jgi:ABC-type phosphate/phosphonate transport system substrate-binding protein
MNNRKGLLKVLSVLLALVTLSLFTAACGDDDESSEQNTTKPDNGWPSKITFGAVPAEAASSLEADYEHTRANRYLKKS